MLNLKKLLTKLCGRVNYHFAETYIENQSIPANQTKWITISTPSSGKAIGISGWYFSATDLNAFSVQLHAGGCSIALRNPTNAELTTNIRVYFTMVD